MSELLPEDMTPEIRYALNKGFKATAKGTTYYDAGESWNALKAELNRRAPSPIVLADWKLVPVEPTEAMTVAGWKAHQGPGERECRLWRAMLAAAPPAPALDEVRERVAFETWCVNEGGYTTPEVSQRDSYGLYLPAIDGDWIVWLAAKRHARGEG